MSSANEIIYVDIKQTIVLRTSFSQLASWCEQLIAHSYSYEDYQLTSRALLKQHAPCNNTVYITLLVNTKS